MDRLNAILEKRFGINSAELMDSMGPQDLASWDSLSHLYLISDLEDEFEVEFDVEHVNAMRSIGDIKKVLRSLGVE